MLTNLYKNHSKKHHSKNLIVITDLGRDPDDEVLFLQIAGLQRLGLVDLKAVVVNQSPLLDRAVLAKSMFNSYSAAYGQNVSWFAQKALDHHIKSMGMGNVPIATGTAGDAGHVLRPYEFGASYYNPSFANVIQPDAQVLLKEQCEALKKHGEKATLLLVSAMHDADTFLDQNKALFKDAIEDVVIMGGVEKDNDIPFVDEQGCVIPDMASNNRFGNHLNDNPDDHVSDAARRLYRTLQLERIPTTIITREAAYAVRLDLSYYDGLAATGHPVAIRLQSMQQEMIFAVLEDVLTIKDHPRLTPEWFAKTFLKDPNLDLKALLAHPDELLANVKGANPYDPLTVLYAVFPNLFAPYQSDAYPVQIIGLSEQDHGIKDLDVVHQLLSYLPRVGFGAEPVLERDFLDLPKALNPKIQPAFMPFLKS